MPSFRGVRAANEPGIQKLWRDIPRCAIAHLRFDASHRPGMTPLNASNMITLRTVLPAFIAAKPSLISESFSFAEIQSSRCSLPRM